MHPFGASLGAEHRPYRVRVGRTRGQPVDGVGRHDDHTPTTQHLGGGQCAVVVGVHDPHDLLTTAASAPTS